MVHRVIEFWKTEEVDVEFVQLSLKVNNCTVLKLGTTQVVHFHSKLVKSARDLST